MALEESTIALADPSLLHEQAFIDGQWSDADSGATFAVTDPGTGEVLARVPRMGAGETRRAVEAAQRAQAEWARRPAAERAAILRTLRDLMMEHRNDLLGREGPKYGLDDWVETRYLSLGGISE